MNQPDALMILKEFKNKIFFGDEIIEIAKQAYIKTVSEKVTKDLHNSSTSIMESFIDNLISINDDIILESIIRNSNPNHLAFLHARMGNAFVCLANPENLGAYLPFEREQFLHWALVDLWSQTPDSEDRY